MGKLEPDKRMSEGAFPFHAGRVDESGFAVPAVYAAGSRGFSRFPLVDRSTRSVHMGASICRLEPGGSVDACVHAYEKGIYVLSGEMEMKRDADAFRLAADIEIEGERHPLGPGDFAWTGVGTCHAFFQKGGAPFRWIETQAPQFPEQHASRNYATWEKLRARMKPKP